MLTRIDNVPRAAGTGLGDSAQEGLGDMLAILGDRESFLCREATKLHEEYRRGRLEEIRDLLADRPEVKGEIVLVVAGAKSSEGPKDSPEALFERLTVEGLTRREAVKEVTRRLGLPAREVYKRVLKL